MTKFILAVAMFIWGTLQLVIPELRDLTSGSAGHIWIVGAIILAWMPKEKT